MAPVAKGLTEAGPAAAAPRAPVLRLVGGTKSYERAGRRVPVFADVDLELRRGEIVVLLGPSGCGKSTLLRTLAGLEPLDRGRIEVEAADHWADGKSARAHAVGIAFQEPSLLPWLSVAENVALGLRFAANRRADRGRPPEVASLLVELGLSDLAAARPSQLSGGQAQRVNVARVVLTGRPILLLDEPFAALDPATRADLQAWLAGLVRSHELATLLVTHDVDEAIGLGDRIVLLAGHPGRIRRTWSVRTQSEGGALWVDLADLRSEILAAYRADEAAGATTTPSGAAAALLPVPPNLGPNP